VHIKRLSKHKYSKNPHIQAPPLPILYPPILNSGLISTPNEAVNKTETNIMSTAFNVPNCNMPSTSYNSSVPNFITNSFLTSVPLNSSYSQSMQSYDNLMSPFQNLSLTNQLTPSIAQSSLNSMSLENITNSYQMGNFMSNSLTNSSSLEPKSIEVTSSLTLFSTDNTSSNVMSTSFSNHLSNIDSTLQNDTYVAAEFDNNDKKPNALTVLNGVKTSPSPLISNPLTSVQSEDTLSVVNPIVSTCNNPSISLFNSGTNLMSTSFNNPEDPNDDTNSNSCDSSINSNSASKQKHSVINIPPPPPSITNSLANYIHNLPKKNYVLSRSTAGLTEMDDRLLKFQHIKPLHNIPNLLQQNSVSDILQNHHRNNNFQSTRKYRLDYDLDYIPFHNSCDNLNTLHSNTNHMKSNSYNIPSKSYDGKHFKLPFSQSSTNINMNKEHRQSSNIPPLPIISTSNDKSFSPSIVQTDVSTNTEKPKVKFSDTVTHILVPNSVRTYYFLFFIKPKYFIKILMFLK
jgi:hypothetical protein